MPYLYASAVINVKPQRAPLGPTTLTVLTDAITRHLTQRERFTVYFDWRHWTKSNRRRSSAVHARVAAHTIAHHVRSGPAGRTMRVQSLEHNKYSPVMRFMPDDEWHPAPTDEPGFPITVHCDASLARVQGEQVRGGIAVGKETYTVDLSAAGITRSANAEFLTVCLALLTGARERSPLTVYADETEAVRAGKLLREGQIPPHGCTGTGRILRTGSLSAPWPRAGCARSMWNGCRAGMYTRPTTLRTPQWRTNTC
ncbi:hypothetical protein [Streptomyces acidiscabies]|uniref:Uncharacterized protein n=1 Tax=Streptomyces acidiscabies TaxID=42234 RepID=A0ABU4LWJ8_9ACTN|nr:hypothetical protein [Streptomyces acidiscabies]MDX3020134.1 hypothetical protein [Streptomyces acidiscabies]